MPILPSADTLGQTAIPQARTAVNSYTTGDVAKAVGNAGDALTKFGGEVKDQQDKLELARAKSYWLSEQTKANSDLEQDQDYSTIQDRYGQRLLDAKKNALGMLSNPSSREMFDTDLEPDFNRGMASVKSVAYKKQVDDGRATFDQTTDDNLQSLQQAPDEATRASIIKAQQDLINATHERGYLTAEEKQKKGTQFVQDYATQRAQMEIQANPQAALDALKPQGGGRSVSEVSQTVASKYKDVSPTYLTTTAAIETGGTFDPHAVNKDSGAAGMFQLMPNTAAGLGVKDPHNPDEAADATARLAQQNAKTLKSSLGRKPSDAELYLAHQQGGGGASALLNNPDENVVDALAKAYDGNRDKARAAVIQNGGDTKGTAKEFSDKWLNTYSDYEEKYRSLNAKDVTPGVKTDGVQVADLNGGMGENVPVATPTTAGQIPFYKKTGTWIDMIPMDKRATLVNNAQSEVRSKQVVNKQLLDARMKDATAQAMQGFTDNNPPTLQDFNNAYDPDEAELHYREYNSAQKVAGTIHQAATMTPAEQTQTLLSLKPKPGTGFAEDQKNYETLTTAISAANTARKADPIAYAQKYQMAASAQPLDMSHPETLPQQLSQRGSLGVQMNQNYGVPLRVFTEPEAQSIATSLNGMTADKRLGWLSTVASGLGDNPTAYTAAMSQLRPASPVTAYAGTYLGLDGAITDSKSLPVTPKSVAAGILQGEDLMNPPKDSEGKETKPAIKMPSPEEKSGMRDTFQDTWGSVFQGQPQAANDAFEASRAYYASLSAKTGSYDGRYDADRWGEAMKAIMGNQAPVRMGSTLGFGGTDVLAPWGMPEDKFIDAAKTSFDATTKAQGLKNWNFDDVTFQGTGRPGEYTASMGTTYMVDKKGFPVIIKVSQ